MGVNQIVDFEDSMERAMDAETQQTADIASAWIAGEMLLRPDAETPGRFRVIIVRDEDRRIVADYHTEETPNGITHEDSHPVFGMVGDRFVAKTIREMGFTGGKRVRYNLITGDLEIVV